MVTPIPPDPAGRGGIPLVLDGQLQGLLRHHDVDVLTVAGPDRTEIASAASLRATGVAVHAVVRHEPKGRQRWERRRRFVTMWGRGQLPWRTVWFWDERVQRAIDELVDRVRYDLIAVEDNAMANYRYPRSVPSVLTEHEVRRPRPIRPPPHGLSRLPRWALGELDWRRWSGYERRVWPRFDRLHVFGQRDQAAITQLAPELAGRVRVVPFGLSLPPMRPRVVEQPDSLLFVGNFTHAPNVEGIRWFVAEVLPRVAARRPSVSLTVAGARPPAEILALSGPRVTVDEDPPDVEPLIASAAVILAPLRIGGGMRVKVVQALARGKAVVASTRAAEGLPLDTGVEPLIVSDDPGLLAERVIDLLADDRARDALAVRARQFAEVHLSDAAYGRRLEASYAEVLEHRAARSPA